MAEDIVEIIHKLTFELGGQGLQDTVKQLQKQATLLEEQKRQYAENQQALERGEVKNILAKKKLIQEQEKLNQEIKKNTVLLKDNFTNNNKLQSALQNEIGLIGKLEQRLAALRTSRRQATSVDEIKAYNRQIEDAKRQLSSLNGNGGGLLSSVFGGGSLSRQLGQGLLYGLGIGGGFGIVTRLTTEMVQFAQASADAYREIEGVRIAFNRLGQSSLLTDLREATQGTVDDLTLMQYAVQANNFEVPLGKLAGLFKFARQRARETGVEVDYLVKSIIRGIGRESPKILDNLGINIRTVREEFNRTGDYATAVFNVIENQGANATKVISTLADEQDRVNASIKNGQAQYGKFFAEIQARAGGLGLDIAAIVKGLLDPFGDDAKFVSSALAGNTASNLDLVNQSIKLTEEQAEAEAAINRQAEQLYKTQFEKFNKEIENADFAHKEKLIQQQKDLFKDLLKTAQNGFIGLMSLQRANQTFLENSGAKRDLKLGIGTNKQVPLQYLMQGNYSLEQLQSFQKEIGQGQSNLGQRDSVDSKEFLKYEQEIQRQIDIITGKKKSEKKARAGIERQLWQQINQLEREGSLLYLQNTVEADTTILEERNKINLKAALDRIDIQEEAAKKQGQLNENTQTLFNQIRLLTEQNFNTQLLNDKEEWWRKRVSIEQDFYNKLLATDVENLKREIDLQIQYGEDSYNKREELLQAELKQKLQKNATDYDNKIEAARKLGQDTTEIEKDFAEREILIREEANREKLKSDEEYYKERLSLAKTGSLLVNSTISSSASEELSIEADKFNKHEIGLRKFNNKIKLIRQQEHRDKLEAQKIQADAELKLAQENYNRIANNPNASSLDVSNATSNLNAARKNSTDANLSLSLLAKPRTGVGRFLNGQEDPEQTVFDRRQENIQNTINAYETMANAAVNSINTILQAQIASLDAEIQIREQRVETARILAERGNAEILKIEQNRLEESIKEKEKAARKQIAINAALQVSESLVAIATAAGESGAGAIVIVPAVIAAIAAGFAAVQALSDSSTPGFKDGVVGLQGKGTSTSDSINARLSKGESVITAEGTEKNRAILEAINNGAVFSIPNFNTTTTTGSDKASRYELSVLSGKMDEMIAAYQQTGVNVTQKTDVHGFSQSVEKNVSKNKSRYSR